LGGAFYNVTVGRHALNSTEEEVIAVKAEAPHPDYDPMTSDYDFMLIFLNASVTHNVEFVKLDSEVQLSNASLQSHSSHLTVIGWGDTAASDNVFKLSNVLMETELKLITNKECARSNGTIYGTEMNYYDQITENMLCAKDSGKDLCQGDSGGPLVLKSILGADVQVGVVSWGMGCLLTRISWACILESRPPTIGSEKQPAGEAFPLPLTSIVIAWNSARLSRQHFGQRGIQLLLLKTQQKVRAQLQVLCRRTPQRKV
jgi:trypsin